MKKVSLLSVICFYALISISCSINVNSGNAFGKKIVGNGVVKEETRTVPEFSVISARGSVDVYIADAASPNITVSGEENILEYIETSVENGVLNLNLKDGYNYTTKKEIKITVPNNGKIKSVTASGSSDVTVESVLEADEFMLSSKGSSDFKGNIKADRCKFSLSGSSDFRGNIEAETFEISSSGSSDCIITGKANVCNASLSGSSDIKGYGFVVEKLDCSLSGSSDIQITCNKELNAVASGSSDVNYKGNAVIVSKKLSGSSDINHKN